MEDGQPPRKHGVAICGRTVIAIPGLEANYPVVHRQITLREFAVFFDLG
jgi:hypothetical protein